MHELDAVAYYAAWPVQAYIEGFTVSNAITLTYTHMDAWDLEGWISSKEGDRSNSTVVEKKVTLKINGGTVKAAIAEISPTREAVVLKEGWAK